MTSADICRANGWGVGTVLEGRFTEQPGPGDYWAESRIRITAVGEGKVLAVETSRRSKGRPEWCDGRSVEMSWHLEGRDWRPVAEAEGEGVRS